MHGIDALGRPLAAMTGAAFLLLAVGVARARHRYERAVRTVREHHVFLRALREATWWPE